MFRPAEVETRDSIAPGAPVRFEVKSRRRLWLAAIGAFVLLVLVLAGIKASQIAVMIKAGKAMVPPPESVTSAKAELTGTVREIAFQNGGPVKQGQVLVRLDTSSEQAQLEGALADAELARQTLDRARALRKDAVNTQADLEAAEARATQTTSVVANLRAIIAKKIIRAPFDGRAGIRQVELGQVVSPGTPIVSLQTVTPIYAEFQLPQQALADVKLGQTAQLKVDVFPGSSWKGTVTTINPEVDPGTRNVRMRATVPNEDGRLTPGMFASVEVLSEHENEVLIVPATSVIYAPFGDSVYVLEDEKGADGKVKLVAHQRFVRTGERRGDFVAIVSGLKPGETVASNGAFKLRNGMAVQVNNALAPPAELNPTPVDP